MKDKKNLFDVNPSDQHMRNVEKAVESSLEDNRRKNRRKILGWILTPALASFLGFFIWRKKSDENFNLEQAMLLQLDDVEDLEVVVNIDFIEDLDFLEEWDESTET